MPNESQSGDEREFESVPMEINQRSLRHTQTTQTLGARIRFGTSGWNGGMRLFGSRRANPFDRI